MSSYFVLVGMQFDMRYIGDIDNGTGYMRYLFDNRSQIFESGLNAGTVKIYGFLAFMLMNALLLLTLVLGFIFRLGRLGRIRGFYSMSIWFFMSALVFSAAFGFYIIGLAGTRDILDVVDEFAWQIYVPITSAFVLMVIAIIFRRIEMIR